MKRLPLVLGLVFALVVLVGIGCEKEVVKEITVHDTVTVQIVVHNVNVDTVTADPSEGITPGETVELVADVSTQEGVDASNLKYDWFTDAGKLVSTNEDTAMWKAADSSGSYTVSVHVSADNQYIGIGSRMLAVGDYVPTADEYYVGVSTCDNCHTSIAEGWAETGHAHAWETLQASDHAASYCEPCHTVNQVDVAGNSGFDEVPTVQFEDVQCESCHGPGSEHPSDNPAGTIPTTGSDVLQAETCGVCHEGAHHPFYQEWQTSAHAFDPAAASHTTENAGCQPCHSGTGFVAAYDAQQSDLWANSTDKVNISCGVCHDPHSADNPSLLRSLADVTLVNNGTDNDGDPQSVISGIGAGQLCVQCHHARHAPEGPNDTQISEGDAHIGPHLGTQGDAVYGESGFEGITGDGFTTMEFASSGHGLIEDACAACHVNSIPFGEFAADSAYVGHTFEPMVEACAGCHGEISDFADIKAKKDFDNDGTIEGIQTEVSGLIDMLVDELYTDFAATYVGTDPAITADVMIDSLENTEGETVAEAVRFRSAGYNLVYVEDDGSLGVHNPAYIIQLLQQSILFLDSNAIPPENILRTEDRLATTFAAR